MGSNPSLFSHGHIFWGESIPKVRGDILSHSFGLTFCPTLLGWHFVPLFLGWHFVPLFAAFVFSSFLVFLYFVTFCVTCHSSLGLTVIFFITFCQAKFRGEIFKNLVTFLAFFEEMNHLWDESFQFNKFGSGGFARFFLVL